MMITPTGPGRASLRRGDRGWDVAAVQIAYNGAGIGAALALDGDYGTHTELVAKRYQLRFGLKADGVTGPATQRSLCVNQSRPAETGLPKRLLESLMLNESGLLVTAYSKHPSDSGYDLGAYQDSIVPSLVNDQTAIRRALRIGPMAQRTADKIKTQHARFVSWGIVSGRRAWELAVLYHNWPVAAERLAAGKSIFIDPARDTQPADWVISASGGRLQTPREWVASYIAKATQLVEW